MLIALATRWLLNLNVVYPYLLIIAGIIPGILVARFGFSQIVNENILRIEAMEATASVFAFQAWHSYVLIVIMMSLGMYVRHSGLIPMLLKTPGYYTIGTALSLSSVRYYMRFIRLRPNDSVGTSA